MQVEIDFSYLDILTSILSRVHFNAKLGQYIKCAVAGGAIRDMLLQKPVSDIDVFYEGDLSYSRIKEVFKNVKESDTTYPDGFNVTHQVFHEKIPVPIQLIQVKNIEEHIQTFPCEFSRVGYDMDKGLFGISSDLVYSVEKKEFMWDSKVDCYYFDKIKEKYSDWKHVFLTETDNPYHEEELF